MSVEGQMQSLTHHGPTQRAIILQQFYLHSVLNARCFPPGSSATEFPGWHLNDFGQLSSCPCTHTDRSVHYKRGAFINEIPSTWPSASLALPLKPTAPPLHFSRVRDHTSATQRNRQPLMQPNYSHTLTTQACL